MRFDRCIAWIMMALAAGLAACTQSTEPDAEDKTRAQSQARAGTVCKNDPHPCGGEWPEGLEHEFEFDPLQDVREVRLTAHDGTLLHGWVAIPRLPKELEGLRMPTILASSPYYDSVSPGWTTGPGSSVGNPITPGDPGVGQTLAPNWWDDPEDDAIGPEMPPHSPGFAPIRLIRKGYALAYFSVRGTGASGGCFGWGNSNDQLDQRTIIEWIAGQDWSNGRVGMVGLSAPSYSAWQAAMDAPAALKTIVTAGDLTDLYQLAYTPQGARTIYADAYLGQWQMTMTTSGGNAQADRVEGRPDIVQRAGCMPWEFLAQETTSLATGDRNAAFWLERPQSTRLDQVRAAVLDTAGYYELAGHWGQDSMIWGSLPRGTPLVQVRGWWGHDWPRPRNYWNTELWDDPSSDASPGQKVKWREFAIAWFDYWLKGIGPEPRTGVIYHQDQNRQWHEATNWSPEPSKKEVLYLSPTGLATTPGSGATSFRSAPNPLDLAWAEQASASTVGAGEPDDEGMNAVLCPSAADASLRHVYTTSVMEAPVLVAGNPFAFVKLSSDQPGGIVTVTLYDLAPEFTCTGARATGARYVSGGAADLEFYSTPYLAHAFPVATPTEIRIDLADVTYLLEPRHRLALAVSSGGPYERGGTKYAPIITIDGTSELIVPVVEGTFGGGKAGKKYPQRPFTPEGYED